MDKSAQIKQALKEVLGIEPNLPVVGTVTAVDGQTCSVKLASQLVVTDVRLKATVSDGDDYLLLTPAIGSDVVMISSDGTLRNLTVIKVDKLEKFKFSQNGLVVEFDGDDGKASIRNDDTSLKDLFTEIKSIISELKVYTSTGPSGTPLPDTITSLMDFEMLFNKLLK